MASTALHPASARLTTTHVKRLAWFTLAWNILVVLWGAIVRATGSGAGCGNHWPLCNGEVIPHTPRVDTIIEFTHRMMSGGAGVLTLALLLAIIATLQRPYSALKAILAATVLLINEAILGALLVKLGYVTGNRSIGRVIVLSIHLSNTLLLLGAYTLTVYFLERPWRFTISRRNLWLSAIGLVSTLVVGVSGSLAALGDTLFPATSLRAAFVQDFASNSPMLLRLRSVHPLSAFLATVFVIWLLKRSWGSPLANFVLGLLAFQIALGFADLLLLAPTWMQVLHLLGADLYWVALLWLSAQQTFPLTKELHA
ncbi:COX15/CtaA family protein [Terriglobus albidus]|uniref:COX15/CtaA family protein n=1 Tax=Terriglobus albidus TaxID=1592106 RepID=UPI0021DFEBEA|nr:COX15/CtaA family protein [Terriglobus albidus]